MIRSKATHSRKKLHELISLGNVTLTDEARESARDTFGWDIEKVCKAILSLPITSCYKSENRYGNPEIWVDYYRARNIKGENIYTHFYVDDGNLIIDSFKEI